MMAIKLTLMDTSAISVSHAIAKYYLQSNSIRDNAVIDIQEVADHLSAFAKAERDSKSISEVSK